MTLRSFRKSASQNVNHAAIMHTNNCDEIFTAHNIPTAKTILSSLPGNESLKIVERIVSSSTSALNVSMFTIKSKHSDIIVVK